MSATPETRLEAILRGMRRVAVAVSGGVDSLTLACLAHRTLGSSASMHHATSPAVPAEATARTRALAAVEGWSLDVFDAGEFTDARYRANPGNRCFYCKNNLYGAIASRLPEREAQIVSGTNLDDLGEYRPGLEAARQHEVRHPYVEAGIDKAGLRRIAARLGLGDVASLPAAPCLASRIETGLAIEAPVLGAVHAAERLVAAEIAPRTVRCRVRAGGIVIELDEPTLGRLDDAGRHRLRARVDALLAAAGVVRPVSFAPYRTGSAFLRSAR